MIADPTLFWSLVLALHLLAAVIWVGGMAYTLLVLRPALNVLEPAQRNQMHMQTLRRFFLVIWHAMPLVLLTGYAMVIGVYGGFRGLPRQVNIMQGLAIIMAAVFVAVFFGPWQRFRRAIRPGPELVGRIRRLITVNLVLGVIVIVAAAIGHGFGYR
jgi:uncharacterized membrane protein